MSSVLQVDQDSFPTNCSVEWVLWNADQFLYSEPMMISTLVAAYQAPNHGVPYNVADSETKYLRRSVRTSGYLYKNFYPKFQHFEDISFPLPEKNYISAS